MSGGFLDIFILPDKLNPAIRMQTRDGSGEWWVNLTPEQAYEIGRKLIECAIEAQREIPQNDRSGRALERPAAAKRKQPVRRSQCLPSRISLVRDSGE